MEKIKEGESVLIDEYYLMFCSLNMYVAKLSLPRIESPLLSLRHRKEEEASPVTINYNDWHQHDFVGESQCWVNQARFFQKKYDNILFCLRVLDRE